MAVTSLNGDGVGSTAHSCMIFQKTLFAVPDMSAHVDLSNNDLC